MVLSGKDWGRYDKIGECEIKEKNRLMSKRYYDDNKKKVISRNKRNYKANRLKLIKELGGACKFCGHTLVQNLNFHHTVPMTVYESKIYHYMRNKDILCLLCVRCHVTYHNIMDELYIDDIYKEW